MELTISILTYGAQWAIETVFLLLALWVMVRIQKLQYNIGGLAVSAAIACALDLIPFVGHYIALAVLWVCLTKVTREDFTGVVFTAAISYALVFGMNLFLLGALMGDLRVSARDRSLPTDSLALGANSDEGSDGAPFVDLEDEDSNDSPTPSSPTPPEDVRVPSPTAAAPPKSANVQVQPSTAPAPAAIAAAKSKLAKAFTLKAASLNGAKSTAVIFNGVSSYTLGLGETVFVATPEGAKRARLEKLDSSSAILDVDGEKVRVAQALSP